MNTAISIEIAYAEPQQQWLISLNVELGTTIEMLLQQPEVRSKLPALDFNTLDVGIFSIKKERNYQLQEGDRLELYRPLIIDPKERRRQRAEIARLKNKKGAN